MWPVVAILQSFKGCTPCCAVCSNKQSSHSIILRWMSDMLLCDGIDRCLLVLRYSPGSGVSKPPQAALQPAFAWNNYHHSSSPPTKISPQPVCVFVYLPFFCTGPEMFMRSKIDRVKFGVWGPRKGVPRSLLSSRSPRDVAWVRGTSVVSISLREVEAVDSYCHQGVNRRKKGAD